MIIICDFDRTVFDTERLYKLLSDRGLSAKAGSLGSLEEINPPELLFEDSIEFFKKHTEHTFHIVSSVKGKTADWDIGYQEQKVSLSGIGSFVSSVSVVQEDKSTVIKELSQGQETLFVDDIEDNLKSVVAANPSVRGVLMDRQNKCPRPSFPAVESFLQLDDIMKRI